MLHLNKKLSSKEKRMKALIESTRVDSAPDMSISEKIIFKAQQMVNESQIKFSDAIDTIVRNLGNKEEFADIVNFIEQSKEKIIQTLDQVNDLKTQAKKLSGDEEAQRALVGEYVQARAKASNMAFDFLKSVAIRCQKVDRNNKTNYSDNIVDFVKGLDRKALAESKQTLESIVLKGLSLIK